MRSLATTLLLLLILVALPCLALPAEPTLLDINTATAEEEG